jgi:hypothetical protein
MGRDSIAQGAAKPWVTSTTERKPQRGAIPIGRPTRAGYLGPLGLFSRDYSVPRAAPWAIESRPIRGFALNRAPTDSVTRRRPRANQCRSLVVAELRTAI